MGAPEREGEPQVSIPDWYELILLGLASWRTWVLLSSDTILDGARRYVTKWKSVEEFIECPYCLGFWVALAWWGAWQAWPHGTLVLGGVVAIAALVPIIERLTSED